MRVYEAIAIACEAWQNCQNIGNEEWEYRWDKRVLAIQNNILPSGSGFDNGSQIDMDSTPLCLCIVTAFHHMNEGGFYDGWTDHIVRVRPNLARRYDMTISGRNPNDIKSYIHQSMCFALDKEITWEEIDGLS